MPIVIDPAESSLGGILSLEARHQWNDGTVMNDLDASPRIKIDAISGLRSIADGEDNRTSMPGRRGERVRHGLRRGKTVAYEGRVQARSLADLRSLFDHFASEFDDLAEGRMLVSAHPEYSAGFSRFYRGRAITFNDGDEIFNPDSRWPYQQSFALGIRMGDTRFYGLQQVSVETGEIAESGGLAPPATPPLTISSLGDGAGTVTVGNPGTAAADPVIEIFGPISNPVITNLTQGLALAFRDVTIAEGSFLRIDFDARTVLLEGTSDYRSKIDWSLSDWWNPGVAGFLAGDNVIQLRGDTIADPATALITFYPPYTA
jgi:Phage tail protein